VHRYIEVEVQENITTSGEDKPAPGYFDFDDRDDVEHDDDDEEEAVTVNADGKRMRRRTRVRGLLTLADFPVVGRRTLNSADPPLPRLNG
jgi:hypothetical protein